MVKLKRLLLFSGILLFLCCGLFSQPSSLQHSGFVSDYAKTLAAGEKQSLENFLRSVENETGAEVAVVIIESLEGASIEHYANELFNTWGIGKKGKNNGALVLVSMKDRRIRIEVGYGLEPVLPDGLCGRIIRDEITPKFKRGNYYEGLHLGVTAISKALKGETPPYSAQKKTEPQGFFVFFIIWNAFLLFFAFSLFHIIGIAVYLSALIILGIWVLTAGPAFGIGFSETTVLFMLVPFFLVFFMGLFAPVIFAVITWRLKKRYKNRWKEHIPAHLKKTISYSGSSGGFRSGGSRSGGGFGGGFSGGGGASGGW